MQEPNLDTFSFSKDSIRTLTSPEVNSVAGGSTPACLTPNTPLYTKVYTWIYTVFQPAPPAPREDQPESD